VIPNYNNRAVESGGITASTVFGISVKDTVHIMSILRDTLYSDKILAVLREYSANAWDAHREAGKADIPIQVILPTSMEPTLVIRDFGNGLSHEDVFEVYTQYGASTKRLSDNSVGMLGIGCKSGFAYSDTFIVESRHGGICRTYAAVLDDTEQGEMKLLDMTECGDATGITIKIPIKSEDIDEFEEKAQNLYQYFNPRPDINIDLPDRPATQLTLKHGILDEQEHSQAEWVAVMGCIPYRINVNQINGLEGYVNKLSGALFFDIGEVQISASREELKYSSSTKEALKRKFDIFIEEYVRHAIKVIEDKTQSFWDRRVRLQILSRLHLPIPPEYKELVLARVPFDREKISKFFITIGSSMAHAEDLKVHESTRLVIKDNERPLTEYIIGQYDYIIRPTLKNQLGDVSTELGSFLDTNNIRGIPVVLLSSLQWTPPRLPPKKNKNPKHQVTSFVLRNDISNFGYPWSGAWIAENRVPTDSDIFVILQSFKCANYNFYLYYRHDYELIKGLDVCLPRIYGYKNTGKVPLDPSKIKGTEFSKWHKELPASLLVIPKINRWVDALEWNLIGQESYVRTNESSLVTIKNDLGTRHPIYKMLKKQDRGNSVLSQLSKSVRHHVERLAERLYDNTRLSEARKSYNAIKDRYPLLGVTSSRLDVLWSNNRGAWVDYIKLVDRALPISEESVEENDE